MKRLAVIGFVAESARAGGVREQCVRAFVSLFRLV